MDKTNYGYTVNGTIAIVDETCDVDARRYLDILIPHRSSLLEAADDLQNGFHKRCVDAPVFLNGVMSFVRYNRQEMRYTDIITVRVKPGARVTNGFVPGTALCYPDDTEVITIPIPPGWLQQQEDCDPSSASELVQWKAAQDDTVFRQYYRNTQYPGRHLRKGGLTLSVNGHGICCNGNYGTNPNRSEMAELLEVMRRAVARWDELYGDKEDSEQ